MMCHVLVIEDDWLIAEDVADIARTAGATSIVIVDSEPGAVAAALERPPAVILSDVKLVDGTGPRAVEIIQRKLGPIPTIFITGTPEACDPCDPPAVVLEKPVNAVRVAEAFRRMKPR